MKSLHLILGLLVAASAATPQQYVISTIAGTPQVQGYFPLPYSGGPTGAQFFKPISVTVDSKGNYYVGDVLDYTVSEITPAGVISTLAGTGTVGFGYATAGTGNTLAINDVHGIGTDLAGNLYFADTGNGVVGRVDPTGILSTFAGINGVVAGYAGDGGPATKANLARPVGVVADSAGNVYISDFGNLTVRKVAPNQTITTVAGTGNYGYTGDGGPANKATFGAPYAIAIDSAGNLYISDIAFNNIRKVTTNGNIQTVASNVNAQSIAVDPAGNIYFPDFLTNTVKKVLPSGVVATIAGNGTPGFSGDGGVATFAQLNQPYGVALDSSGNVYVADSGNAIIRRLTPTSPAFSIGSIVNSASGLVGPVAPGEIVVLYGTGLGPASLVSNQIGTSALGTQAGGVSVAFDGTPAPILYASATQVAVIVPYEESPQNIAQVTLTYQGQTTPAVPLPIVASAPGLFTMNSSGSGQAAALNGATNPAPVGSYLSLYATGEGLTNPGGVDGLIASATPYPRPQLTASVTIGGQMATVIYAGGAPGEVAGVMQVNVQIPAGVQPGNAVPVVLQVGTATSQAGVTIAVSAH